MFSSKPTRTGGVLLGVCALGPVLCTLAAEVIGFGV